MVSYKGLSLKFVEQCLDNIHYDNIGKEELEKWFNEETNGGSELCQAQAGQSLRCPAKSRQGIVTKFKRR